MKPDFVEALRLSVSVEALRLSVSVATIGEPASLTIGRALEFLLFMRGDLGKPTDAGAAQ